MRILLRRAGLILAVLAGTAACGSKQSNTAAGGTGGGSAEAGPDGSAEAGPDGAVDAGSDGALGAGPDGGGSQVPVALAHCAELDTNRAPFNVNSPSFSANGYVRNPITSPIGDGMSMYVPDPQGQPYIKCGLVDVAAPPFDADPTGATDSTAAINKAIDYARRYMLVSYFPVGTYRVSDTLHCAEGEYTRTNAKTGADSEGPCVLVGSTLNGKRAKIQLAPGLQSFSDPAHPKPVIYVWQRNEKYPTEASQNTSFQQVVRSLDIDLGHSPGAVGIEEDAAQGSSIQDVHVDATGAYAGIQGLQAGGGGTFQVEVTGGVYGIDASQSQADGPIISGSTFSGQTGSAIYYGASETLTVVGVKIDMAPQSTGPAIRCKARGPSSAFLSVVDSQIEFPSYDQNNKAIASNRSVYTQNVYVDNAGTLYQVGQNALPGGSGWKWIQEAGRTVGSFQAPIPHTSYVFTIHAPIYLDRVRTTLSNVKEMGPDGTAPPADLQSRHQWNATSSPSFDSPDAVNVKDPPYNAAGDGTTDDTQALQSAINAHDVIFLPKGYYRISQTLHLKPNTKLVGIAQNLSQIIPTDAGGFADTAKPAPLVETANDASATTSLAFVGLFVFRGHAGAYPLHWQAGKDSIFRTSAIIRRPEHGYGHFQGEVLDHPLVLIDGNGGGRWYAFNYGMGFGEGPPSRYLLVKGTRQPLRFYHLNPEHGTGEAQVEFDNVRYVSVYGIKGESGKGAAVPVLWIRDSDYVNVYGNAGMATGLAASSSYPANYAQFPPSLYRVERTPNLRLVNMIDRLAGPSPSNPSSWIPTDKWNVILDVNSAGNNLLTDFLDRPFLFQTGYATWQPEPY